MKRLMAFCLALMLLVCAMPMHEADAATTTATVKGGWLRLRESPSTSANTIASFYTGTKVTILGSTGNWYHVQVGGYIGYMMGSYLDFNADSGSSGAPSGNLNITAWVRSDNGKSVRLRSGPSTAYDVLGSYPVGTQVTILAKGTYWFQISVNGKIGYMMSQYLTTTQPSGGASTPPTTSGTTAWVWAKNGGNCNLRSGASKSYGVLGSYSVGTQVTILTYGKTWCYIRIGTRTGYMMTEFLTTTQPSGGTTTPPTTGSYTAYVTSGNGGGVNMRTGAGTSFRVIVQLPVGTQVTVLQHNATWDYVRYGTTDGYMQNIYLTTIPPTTTQAPPTNGYYATVYASSNVKPVNMRKGAGTGYGIIASVPQGTKVLVLSESNGWCYISYNGITGYMMKKYLVADTTAATAITAVGLNNYSPKPGDTLSASITPAGATVTYAWVDQNGVTLATTATYTVRSEDLGKQIAVRVTGTGSYSGSITSPYATVTEAAKVQVTGVTLASTGSISAPKAGDRLTAKAMPEGATASYKWYRGNGALVGEGAEYTVKAEDAGYTLYCVATGTGNYVGEAKSDTGVVVGVSGGEATQSDL